MSYHPYELDALERRLRGYDSAGASSRAQRSAPPGGYDYFNKALFREWAWDEIKAVGHWSQRSYLDVAAMPSVEGTELTEHAWRKHFSQSRTHVIDKNPAIVATLKRRFNRVHTYGVSVARAHQRMARRGVVLAGASLDFCSPGGKLLASEVGAAVRSGAYARGAIVVVNMLRGRESTQDTDMEPDPLAVAELPYFMKVGPYRPTAKDWWRVWRVCRAAQPTELVPRGFYKYKARSYQTFLGVSFRVMGDVGREPDMALGPVGVEVGRRVFVDSIENYRRWYNNMCALTADA